MTSEEREKLFEKIQSIDSQITVLNDLKQKLTSRLATGDKENPARADLPINKNLPNHQNYSNLSTIDKINLFRSLFRGREDVYARYWVSRKTGKSGYSPVCKNEWVSKICQKPIMRCSLCPNRELIPVDDEVIRKHLTGIHVAGIYPMLRDETCYVLAVDFDGEGWVDNVFAFKETCAREDVPVAIERSRSGKGAHVWIFFEESIPASVARRMGSFLITKTMSRRYQLDMKSYDRLFPNQDTLPKGGFGNLIALPFQKEAARFDNSVFIDENYKPYHDQWQFLLSVKKMSLPSLERFSKEESTARQVLNIRQSPVDDNDLPWMRLPSGRKRYKPSIADLPRKVELVLANRIYIKTDGVPSVLLNQIKRLAAFQNPEFYKRQSMRLSTFLTPRIVSCSEFIDGYLATPRGCLEDISCLMNEYGVGIDIRDERISGKKVSFKFYGTLAKEQKAASRKILQNDTGVLVAPPGTGKTVIAINIIAKRKTNTLILVHRKPLMEQWRLRLASFLGIGVKDIGQIGAGKNKANGTLDIAMIQSLERKGKVDDRVLDYSFIIVDECHHISAVSFEKALMQAKAKYVLGLTATPYRRDGHQPIIHMQCGPIRCQKKPKNIKQGISLHLIIPRSTEFMYEWKEGESDIYNLWPKLIDNKKRNDLIVSDVIKAVRQWRFPIILTERREHLEILADKLKGSIENLAVLYGGLKPKKRKEALEELAKSSKRQKKAILAIGAYLGEGFDDQRLDALFLTMPISFKGRIVQYTGRLHRQHQGKTDVHIYDYVDENVSVLAKMYQKRLKTYKMMGYEIQ